MLGAMSDLPTTPEGGLDPAEAARRLAAEGPNVVARDAPKQLWRLIFELVTEPMIALLVILVIIYLVLGELREAIAMSASVLAIIFLTLFQEWRTEKAVAALRDLASPRALVVRGGERLRIPSAEVVAGDRLVLEEGDRVPADGVLVDSGKGVEGEGVHVDESLLTGESVSVDKTRGDEVFSSTLVVGGRAHFVATHTGARTRVGKLGAALADLTPEVSPLRKQVDRLVKVFGAIAVVSCLSLTLGLFLAGRGLIPAVLSGIGLAIGLIPEEYPVILTVFLALGAWRMAKEHVLIRRLPAIEALGSATVLTVDKTGTLTENQMRVTAVWTEARGVEQAGALSDEAGRVLAAGALACRRETVEPMDLAFWKAAPELRVESERWTLVRDYPFGRDPATNQRELSAARAFRRSEGAPCTITVKGVPEAVFALASLDEEKRAALLETVAAMGREGLRVLAVAEAVHEGEPPVDRHAVAFSFLGLVGIEDPVRADVPEAIRAVERAGIRILVITGDDPETARAVAKKAGLAAANVIRGAELDALTDAELRERLPTISVIARAVPEHKLRVVQALAARGDVVAMTGDGVNDALALKASAIGIAMGGRGTDVAREAASIVLTDDRFASIVSGLRRGRRIFANLQRASAFIVVVHVVVAGLVLLTAALGLPAALLPLHIVALELLIDPACSVVYESEPEPPGLMDRPPRPTNASLLDRFGIVSSLLVGGLALGVCLALHLYALDAGVSEEASRFSVFVGLVTTILVSIVASRTGLVWASAPNKAFLLTVVAAALALTLAMLAEPVRAALHWEMASWQLLLGSVGGCTLAVVLGQAVARLVVRRTV